MPKLPRWNAAEAETELLKAGFQWLRSKGSHRIYAKGSQRVVIPFHGSQALASENHEAGDRSLRRAGSLTSRAGRLILAGKEDLLHFVRTHRRIPSGLRRHKSARAAQDRHRGEIPAYVGSRFVLCFIGSHLCSSAGQ